MGTGFPTQQRIDHCHLHRLGANGIDRLRPAGPRDPLKAVGVKHAESQKTFGGHCGEQQMSQIGPCLSQMGPINAKDGDPDWRRAPSRASPLNLKGTPMSRMKTYGLALALLASAALSTACTRTDATGPSDQPQASFETQGADN